MSKLALGTVQFGLSYGISNTGGKIIPAEISRIIGICGEHGITTLDTAQAYGDSEEQTGRAIGESGLQFDIVTKLSPDNAADVTGSVSDSMKRLHTDRLYGLLYHDLETYRSDPASYDHFLDLKKAGRVRKTGFSLYYPNELEFLFTAGVDFDLVQIPYNLFDRRFEPWFERMKERGIEIHIRSVFLQGLFFLQPEKLGKHFLPVKEKLAALHELAAANKTGISSICLNFAAMNPFIDKIVIGVDRAENLEQNIAALDNWSRRPAFAGDCNRFVTDDETILLPFNWKN